MPDDSRDRSRRDAPTVLLVTTCQWFTTARLAIAFADCGCTVELVGPRRHPAARLRAVRRAHPYHALAPLHAISAAIAAVNPGFVVPCDDLATSHLHALCETQQAATGKGRETYELLVRSLGDPSTYPVVRARTRLMELAADVGVAVPPTQVVDSLDSLRGWLDVHGLPALLKADGSSGGRGVRIVRSEAEAETVFTDLGQVPSPIRAIKRALVNGEPERLLPAFRRVRPVINIQGFARGRDANSTVACWEGEVLACTHAVVLQTVGLHGPSSVLQLIEQPAMEAAVRTLVAQLGLSGLFGFDFIYDESTGEVHLIEMNPRATQICHLALGERDLVAALCARIRDRARENRPSITTSNVIALFPQEWNRDTSSPFFEVAYHDVPWEEPELVRACLATNDREKAIMLSALPAGALRTNLKESLVVLSEE